MYFTDLDERWQFVRLPASVTCRAQLGCSLQRLANHLTRPYNQDNRRLSTEMFTWIAETILIPVALLSHGLGVMTLAVFRFLPHYRALFRRLWERHKNPISWVCRPFFGLIIAYGAILHSWILILIGVIGIGTSWFWFPKWKQTPEWAEDFINKELETLTPENPWDAKRVLLPSFALPFGLVRLSPPCFGSCPIRGPG